MLLKMGVHLIIGEVAKTGGTIDKVADRISTVSEHDVRAACAGLKITDETHIKEILAEVRIAGDHLGNAEAMMVRYQQISPV